MHSAPFTDSSILTLVTYGWLPTANSTELNNSRYDFQIYNADEETSWVRILLPTGAIGYILANKTSAVLYKEMTVAKIKGQWKIISFYHPAGC